MAHIHVSSSTAIAASPGEQNITSLCALCPKRFKSNKAKIDHHETSIGEHELINMVGSVNIAMATKILR